MQRIGWLLCGLFVVCVATGQPKKIIKNQFTDSVSMQTQSDQLADLPVMNFAENERTVSLPSPLHANRDVFMNTAGFHFSMVRFRLRGLEGNYQDVEFNGIPMNSPEDGRAPWQLWSGLNDVTRNTETSLGLRAMEFSFGNIGSLTRIDTRVSKQRAQTQVKYAFSNRSVTHRIGFTSSSAISRKGWGFAISSNLGYSAEGYMPGSFYSGLSYFIAVDKKINEKETLSFNFFGASSTAGKQGPVTAALTEILGTHYNPYWGYQSGARRNANTRSSHQPVMILRYDRQIDNHRSWTTAIACITGKRTDTGLDWYNAADPRPDYYRYLPAYQQDAVLRNTVTEAMRQDPNRLQVNWERLFEVNHNSYETVKDVNGIAGYNVNGRRSHYILEDRVAAIDRGIVNSVYQSMPGDNISFSTGASLQWQRSHYYKKLNDLLGGEFYVDWNQFAERDFPNDPGMMQNDIKRPNRLLYEGDRFGYDYFIHSLSAKAWSQLGITGIKWDHFIAAEISYMNYNREGMVTNGLFQRNSSGTSFLNEFTGYAVKTGTTYKINGRKYIYTLAGYFIRPPLPDNVFISPKTRDTRQENIKKEKIFSIEAGYLWNAPAVQLRASAYLLAFSDGMNISTFYHDGYANFVNYALSGINKLQYGIEAGARIGLSEKISIQLITGIGRYYYSNRQELTVTADNDASILERGIIYARNFRIGGTPQEIYSAGLNYQSGRFYCDLTASCFREQWIEFNPLRRTYGALKNVAEGSAEWNQIIDQAVLPGHYTIDLSAGSSFRFRMPGFSKPVSFLLYAGINNLLNDRRIVSGGYEQLRFDTETKNTDKFPPKFFYAMGLNFSVNLSFRL